MTNLSTSLIESIIVEGYENIPQRMIANIITKYSSDKPTDTLIESYISEAKKRAFTFNPIVQEIRSLNKLDIIEQKLSYKLKDGTTLVISKSSLEEMKPHLENNVKAIEFMNESKENFMKIFKIIKENKE